MRVLIVGCGYVGLALGKELVRRGHSVIGLRRRREGSDLLLEAGITPMSADITVPQELSKLPCGYDWVVNCVASGGGGSDDYRRVYLEGTAHLLDWLKTDPPRKFVYTSSTSVYGQNDGSSVTEENPTLPASETARVLIETENLLRTATQERSFPAVILRLAGIYGPDRGYWLRQFIRGEARLEGAGERILNMVHRDDVVGAILAALERATPGDIFNVADNEPASQLEVFRWLSQQLGKPMPPTLDAASEPRRRGQTNKRVCNERLRRELGYRFIYPSFREGYAAELSQRETGPSSGDR